MTRTNQPSSSLIVDFPHQVDQPILERSVRFSLTSEMKLFEKSSSRENKAKWYTGREYRLFKHQRTLDAVHCSNLMMYASSVGDRFTNEDIIKMTGLEYFVTEDIPRRAKEIEDMRKSHTALILDAQARLRSTNRSSATVLARVSEMNSQHARKLSHKFAAASFGLSD